MTKKEFFKTLDLSLCALIQNHYKKAKNNNRVVSLMLSKDFKKIHLYDYEVKHNDMQAFITKRMYDYGFNCCVRMYYDNRRVNPRVICKLRECKSEPNWCAISSVFDGYYKN